MLDNSTGFSAQQEILKGLERFSIKLAKRPQLDGKNENKTRHFPTRCHLDVTGSGTSSSSAFLKSFPWKNLFFFFFTAEQYTCWNLALTEQLSIMWYWKYLLAIWKLVVTLPALLKWVFPYLLAITWKHRSILSSAKCLNLKQNSCFKGTSVMENLSVSHGGSNAAGAGWCHWASGGWWTQSIAVK